MKAMTQKQLDLYLKNGSPADFADCCWEAANQLMITDDEARLAIDHYRAEFEEAGRE
jgi:hypothetical protein